MFKRPKKARDSASREEAYAYTLRLLQIRWRGEEELEKRLKEKEFTDEVIQETLKRLKEIGYVNNSRLLEGLIREYKDMRLYGPAYIRQKLLQRQFTREEINNAIAEFYPATDELTIAKQFLIKQKRVSLEDQKEKQRLIQKFIRRGFSPGVAFKVVGHSDIEE